MVLSAVLKAVLEAVLRAIFRAVWGSPIRKENIEQAFDFCLSSLINSASLGSIKASRLSRIAITPCVNCEG